MIRLMSLRGCYQNHLLSSVAAADADAAGVNATDAAAETDAAGVNATDAAGGAVGFPANDGTKVK